MNPASATTLFADPERFPLLATQWPPDHVWTSEQLLMFAILKDALEELHPTENELSTRRGQRLLEETQQWFIATETRWPFSFVNICAESGLDADHIRKGLRESLNRQPQKRVGPHGEMLPSGVQYNRSQANPYRSTRWRNAHCAQVRCFPTLEAALAYRRGIA